MNKLTAEIARRNIGHLKENQANPKVGLSLREELYLQALEKALPVLEQGGWIECIQTMPKSETGVLVGCWFGSEWAMKWATYIPGHPEANRHGWLIPGASWCPTHWQPLPAPPQPQPSTNPQIDNEGWIEWMSGTRPVDQSLMVEVKTRNGEILPPEEADYFDWNHYQCAVDIIAYRVIESGREG